MAKVVGDRRAWDVPTLPAWLADAQKARRWLIEGYLLDEALILMSGQKKRSMKTFSAFTAAIALAAGNTAFGRWRTADRAPVLICEAEGAHGLTRDRLLAICATLGVDPAALDNLYFSFHAGVKLDTALWRERLVAKVEETHAKLVVLDALVYMHSANENAQQEMAPVIETIQELRAHGASVLYLAHLDKTRGSDSKADVDDQVRGIGLLTDAYDQHIAKRRYKMTQPITLTMRYRDGREEHYVERWDIDENDDGVIGKATMHITTEGEADDDHTIRCQELLQSNCMYTLEMLKQLWSASAPQVRATAQRLVGDGVLVQIGAKYKMRIST